MTRNPVDRQGGKGHSMCQGGIGLKWYNLGNYYQFYVGGMSSVCVRAEEGVEGDRDPIVEGHARLLWPVVVGEGGCLRSRLRQSPAVCLFCNARQEALPL